MRRLIVNADDYGRTPGVNEGTLEAHRSGIVTEATVMILEPAASDGIRAAHERAPRLGLGLHCMLTGGVAPASPPGSLPTLAPGGRLAKNREALAAVLDPEEVRRELSAQIALFERAAGRLPSHLDSHHHSALHPSVAPVFAEIAGELSLPVRAASPEALETLRRRGLRVPDFFADGFYGDGATVENLLEILASLPEGTSELMCHPGRADAALRAGSSYAVEREGEIAALCDPRVRARIADLSIALVGFGSL